MPLYFPSLLTTADSAHRLDILYDGIRSKHDYLPFGSHYPQFFGFNDGMNLYYSQSQYCSQLSDDGKQKNV